MSAPQPPLLSANTPLAFVIGLFFMGGVMLALPLLQLIEAFSSPGDRGVDTLTEPPPSFETPPPPEEEEQEEEEIDVDERDFEPPSLEQLEIAFNTDVSGLSSGDFTIPTIDFGQQLQQQLVSISELDRQPRRINEPNWNYPPDMKRNRIEGRVVLRIEIDVNGRVRNARVVESTHPAFAEAAMREVRELRYEPGEKDGKPVPFAFLQPVPYTLRR